MISNPQQQMSHVHPVSGEVMTKDKIEIHKNACIAALTKIEQSRQVYGEVVKTTNDRDAARAASAQFLGGGLSRFWDEQCKQGHICCLVVICPPCNNMEEMHQNQDLLRMLIFKIDSQMNKYLMDIWTSRQEIGAVK